MLMASTLRSQDTAFTPVDIPIPGSSLSMRMVAVKGGVFRMGDKTRSKTVRVSYFWMGAFEP